jgi:hsp70-interacting protein
MWEPLQGLLASPSDDIKVQALWVIGTAVQNNPAAQKAVRSSAPRGQPPRIIAST